MSQAAFARLHAVSRKTVTDWKGRGYLTMVGDLVDIEASNRALASAGRSRLDRVTLKTKTARRIVTRAAMGNTPPPAAPEVTAAQVTAAEACQHARDFPSALNLACIASSADAMVLALLDHLPMATVRPLVERIIAKARADAVELLDEDGEFPAGITTWGQHPWFTDPWLTEAEWQELEEEHEAAARSAGAA